MAFRAQRDGICIKCQKQIMGGTDYISWRRTKGGPSSGEAWHYPTCSMAAVNTPGLTTVQRDEAIKSVTGEPAPRPAPTSSETDGLDVRKALAVLTSALKENGGGVSKEEIQEIINSTVNERLADVPTPEWIEANTQSKISAFMDSHTYVTPELAQDLVRKEIEKRLVKTLVIKQDDKEPKKFDLAHEDLPTLIKLVGTRNLSGHRLNIYMHGEAGSGKSTAARQTAEALNLPFGYASLNPMTPDSRALGFMHAGGTYVPTEFFKRYTEGGVFCFDEIDNASASFVTTLNSALENGHGAFPHGVFARHPDFVCVCTANTIGRGGDIHYPERRALDSAFLERFVFVEWGYDDKLTHAIVGNILGDKAPELMVWVENKAQEYRARFPELVISPRAFIQSALLEAQGFGRKFIEEAAIRRGIKNA